MARSATSSAPANSRSYSWSARPSTMYRPSAPPATSAPSVAVATTFTAAVRTPPRMSGSASGSSTCLRTCVSRRPIPRAASIVSASTARIATNVFVRMGGSARGTSAKSVGQKPRPRPSAMLATSPSAMSASDGNARPMLATLMAMKPPRPVCPRYRPSGSAITSAIATATPESWTCSHTRTGIPSSPRQCAGSANHATTSARNVTLPCPCPRRERALREHECRIGRDGEGDRKERAQQQRRAEEALDPEQDEVAEPALTDERGDRHEPDRRDGGDANAGDDDGQRERQLDPPEHLRRRVAHAGRSLDRVGRHGADATDDVPQQDEERVADEADLGREQGQPGERDEEREESEARDRVQQPRDPRRGRVRPRPAQRGERDRERDRQAHSDRHGRQQEVLADTQDDLVEVAR